MTDIQLAEQRTSKVARKQLKHQWVGMPANHPDDLSHPCRKLWDSQQQIEDLKEYTESDGYALDLKINVMKDKKKNKRCMLNSSVAGWLVSCIALIGILILII